VYIILNALSVIALVFALTLHSSAVAETELPPEHREETSESKLASSVEVKPFTEQVQDWVLSNIDTLAIVFYIIYKLVPKIGGIAKSKKAAERVTSTLDAYFGEGSEKNVLTLQKALSEAQTRFMNDTGDTLENIEKAVAPVKDFVESSASAAEQNATLQNIVMATEGAIHLMASQLVDLVLASPSVGEKKKTEIEAAWVEQEKKIRQLVETVVSANDKKEQGTAS